PMRRWALWGIALPFLFGCSAKLSSYLEVEREQIQALQELTELLSTVKDEASMSAALAELKKRNQQIEQIARKFRALPKPSEEIRQQIDEALGPKTRQAFARSTEELTRISKLLGGKEFLKEMKEIK